MRIMLKPLLASFAVSTLIGGCSVTPHTETLKYAPLQKSVVTFVPESKATYVREVTLDESDLNQKVSLVGSVSLVDALRLKLPNMSIIPKDANIDMTKKINISAKGMYVKDYLEYLSSLSGYDVVLNNGKIEIRSFVEKQWNLAVFASKRNVKLKVGRSFDTSKSGDSSGGADNTITTSFDDDEWSIVIEGAKKILNVGKSTVAIGEGGDGLSPYVQAVRSIGIVSAGGSPQRMNAVDEFVSSIVESGSKQINISVKAFDVTLNDNRGAGIDWKELSAVNASFNGNPIGMAFNTVTGNTFNTDNTLFQSTMSYSSSKVNANFMLQFLSRFGEVELLNQPNVTVRNGSYAYIATGEELTYVGEIETERRSGGDDLVTKTLESIRVGVTLAVTPRILQDGRILLDIWPVVSSTEGSDPFTIGEETQEVPRIALQELSTQVIAESGKSIQLGGFIRRAIAKSLEELPWHEKLTGALIKPLFKSETQSVERRELVLTVTATVVEGV